MNTQDRDLAAVIAAYLDDESKVYEAWYEKLLADETGMSEGQFTSGPLTLPELRQKFRLWLQGRSKDIREKICVEWGYPKQKERYQNHIALAVALASQLSNTVQFPVEVATILVLIGLDEICASSTTESPGA